MQIENDSIELARKSDSLIQQNRRLQGKEKRKYLPVDKDTVVTEKGISISNEKVGQNEFKEDEVNLVRYHDLKIYSLGAYQTKKAKYIGLISMSEGYSESPDSVAIPDLQSEEEYFVLGPKYRKLFLAKTKVPETDSVFIYSYEKDKLVSFTVKNLKVVACLNHYVSESYKPYSQRDYMIGIEVAEGVLREFEGAIVCIGRENQFIRGQMKPIIWDKIETSAFPSKAVSSFNTLRLQSENYNPGSAYKFETLDFGYFVQEYLRENKYHARRLVIIDDYTKDIVHDIFYFPQEGTSLASLNSTDEKYFNQWTGKIFKNKPPVVLGFQYRSCPYFTFLDKSVADFHYSCNNWH
jgi:hypothetical protein